MFYEKALPFYVTAGSSVIMLVSQKSCNSSFCLSYSCNHEFAENSLYSLKLPRNIKLRLVVFTIVFKDMTQFVGCVFIANLRIRFLLKSSRRMYNLSFLLLIRNKTCLYINGFTWDYVQTYRFWANSAQF